MKTKLSPAVLELYPFESRYIMVGGHSMHYVDEGPRDGPVVLLLHGNPTWSFYYRDVIKALCPTMRVIAPDFIGMGLSERTPDRAFLAKERMDHLDAFVAALGLTRYSMVMHDWGGPIGTGFAVRHPEAIVRLVYLNTTLTETESLPKIIKQAASPFIGPFLTKHTMHFIKLLTDWGVTKRLSKAAKEGYRAPYRTRAQRSAIWDFVADIPFNQDHPTYAAMLDIAERLPSLGHVPVQIIWGLRDPCFHREMLTKVVHHFPQASVLEIPDASHLVLEDGAEQAIPVIVDFLTAPAERFSSTERLNRTSRAYGRSVLATQLARQVVERPNADAVIVPTFHYDSVQYRHVKYGELGLMVTKYQRGLSELGLRAGDLVLMLVTPGLEFLALSYAVMARGAVPIFIDPGIGFKNLVQCISDASPDVFIGVPRAHLLRFLRPRLFKRMKFCLVAAEHGLGLGPDLNRLKRFAPVPLPEADVPSTGFVAFTSGATGTPKGVVFTQEMIEEQLRIFRDVFHLSAGGKDLPLLPIFSLFHVPAGITSVAYPLQSGKPLDLDPSQLVRVIRELEVDSSFGSPTLWTKIAEYCVRAGVNLPSLKTVLMAGAPVARSVLERMRRILPNGESYTPYGATEALPVTLVSAQEILERKAVVALTGEEGTFVGRAIAGIEIRVVASTDGPLDYLPPALPARSIGEVLVKGANVSTRYLNRPEATRDGKIVIESGLGESEIWHRMGDTGYLDDEGNLYFCGRKIHVVRTEKELLYPIPVERIFNNHPKVRRSALVAIDAGPDGARDKAIVVEPLPEAWPAHEGERDQFETELRTLASASPLTRSIQRILFHRSFPVDARHNAKIFRDRLGDWATKELSQRQ